jgi:peptidoglycan/LPS O-acetylase OafA/YrhL
VPATPDVTPDAGRRPPLLSLTSLRAWAALLVFCYHLGLGPFAWAPLLAFRFGYVGVSFFFVLSGFVLAWSARPGASVRRFYLRRLARVYPAHLAVLGVVVALTVADPTQRGLVSDPVQGLKQLLLVNAWTLDDGVVNVWNGVSWSLSVEAFCYLCFPLLLWGLPRLGARRQLVVVLGALALALVVTATARGIDPAHGGGVAYLNPLVRLPEFVLGISLALRVRATTRPPLPLWVPLLLCGALGAAAMGVALPRYPLADYLLLPGIALLIVTAARRDVAGRGGALLRHRASVYLGELSFCFYLVHVLVMGAVLRATGWSQPWDLEDGAWRTLAILVGGVLAATVVHHAVERPAQALLARRASRPTTRQLEPTH